MSHPLFRISPTAERDLQSLVDRLAVNRSPDDSERFVDRAQKTFHRIAEQPGIGSPVSSTNLLLAGLRKQSVVRYPDHRVFYLIEGSTVLIVRVLHARQDWWAVLDVN